LAESSGVALRIRGSELAQECRAFRYGRRCSLESTRPPLKTSDLKEGVSEVGLATGRRGNPSPDIEDGLADAEAFVDLTDFDLDPCEIKLTAQAFVFTPSLNGGR
jgi:hypothetical protein